SDGHLSASHSISFRDLQVQYLAVVWRNVDLDANIGQSPSPASIPTGWAPLSTGSIAQARTTSSQLIWTSRFTVGRLQRAVCPRTEQREELLLPCGHLHKAGTWWLLRNKGQRIRQRSGRVLSSEQECRA